MIKRTVILVAASVLLAASIARGQTVAVDRLRFNAAPCTLDSVNGSPDQLRLVDCSTITTATATNLTLSPTGDLVLAPTGVDVLPNTGYTVNLGALSNKYLTLHAAELWVETLVAQNTLATIGGRVLVGPTTTLTQDVGTGDSWVEVKHNQWQYDDYVYAEANGAYEHMRVSWGVVVASSTAPDWIEIENNWEAQFGAGVQFRITTGACTGTWTSTGAAYQSGSVRTRISVSSTPPACTSGVLTWRTDPSDGHYRYWVLRDRDGSGANAWYAGDAIFSTGAVGGGYIDLYATAGVLAGAGPTIVGNVRTGSASYNQVAPRWAIGNLNGLYGYSAEVYGAVFGDASATNVTVDATNGFRIRSGTTNKLAADTSGNLSLTGALNIGTSGSFSSGATAYATGTGWWMDYNAGTPRFRIGNPAGNQLTWDGTTLTVSGNGSGLTAIDGGNITTNTINVGSLIATGFGGNLIRNSTFEGGTHAQRFSGWALDVRNTGTAGTTSTCCGTSGPGVAYFNPGTGFFTGIIYTAAPVIPGQTYRVSVDLYATTTTTAGVNVSLLESTSSSAVTRVVVTGGSGSEVNLTSYTDCFRGGLTGGAYQTKTCTYTAPAGVNWVSLNIESRTGTLTSSTYTDVGIDNAEMQRQIGAGHIQANSITAAQIAAGTITATQIDVTELSSIASDLGHITGGDIELGGGWPSGLTIDENGFAQITFIETFQLEASQAVIAPVGQFDDISWSGGSGGGDQFVCVANNGSLYASPTACN